MKTDGEKLNLNRCWLQARSGPHAGARARHMPREREAVTRSDQHRLDGKIPEQVRVRTSSGGHSPSRHLPTKRTLWANAVLVER